jgi:hypothetical protein
MNDATPLLTDIATPAAICAECGGAFAPRTGNGGRPQRYCGDECRIAANNSRRQQGSQQINEAPTNQNGSQQISQQINEAPNKSNKSVNVGNFEPIATNDGASAIELVPTIQQNPITMEMDACGNLRLHQNNYPDQSAEIFILADFVDGFLDKLTSGLGIPTLGG